MCEVNLWTKVKIAIVIVNRTAEGLEEEGGGAEEEDHRTGTEGQ